MYVTLGSLINTNILNDECVGFTGDSETPTKFGSWSLLKVADEPDFDINGLNTLIDESELIGDWLFWVQNKHGSFCLIKLSY